MAIFGKTYGSQVLLAYEIVLDERDNLYNRMVSRFIDVLKNNGYQDYLTGTNAKGEQTRTALPCNMLWKANISTKDATAECKDAAKFCGIKLKQCFAAEIVGWSNKWMKAALRVDV